MRKTLLFIMFFAFQNAFGQFGIIRNKDGFVNVRESPEISKNIIDTISNGQIIYYYYIEPNSDWYEIDYEKDTLSFSGYVHKSGFKLLTEFESIAVKLRTNDKVIFQKDSIKVTLTKVPFISRNNKLEYGTGNEARFPRKINGKKYWGSDMEIPTTQYEQVSIEWGDKKIDLPKESFENLFEPNFTYKYTAVYFDRESNTIYIKADNGDGAGGYTVLWIIENRKYKSRHLSNAYA